MVHFKFPMMQNDSKLWMTQIFNFLIVWCLFFSLSLCFSPSQICFPSLLTWIQSLHWTTIIFHLDGSKNSSCHLNPVLTNHMALFVYVCACIPPSLTPSSKLHLYLFFLVCGKQMKNLGRKAVSACLLKRTIFARGKCCSNCAVEHARKRGDGTYLTGHKGGAGGDVGAQWASLL